MNYKVISHNYENTGGHTMVSVFEVWLPDENRTVFVNVDEEYSTITTVNFVMSDVEIDDYWAITVDSANYRGNCVSSEYFELHRYCLFEYLKRDCKHMSYAAGLSFVWLPENVQRMITDDQRKYVEDELGDKFITTGFKVRVLTVDGGGFEVDVDYTPKSLQQTLAASLFRCREKLMIDEQHMDADDLGALVVTIKDLEYWMAQTN